MVKISLIPGYVGGLLVGCWHFKIKSCKVGWVRDYGSFRTYHVELMPKISS